MPTQALWQRSVWSFYHICSNSLTRDQNPVCRAWVFCRRARNTACRSRAASSGIRAVTYGDIEALLDGIPARRRLVLIDTCHAGEAEGLVPSESENRPAYQATQVTAFRNVQLVASQPVGDARTAGVSDLLLTGSFADLRRRAGAFVIGAAGAAEYALEQETLRNGVFTGCVLDALRGSGRSADLWVDDVLRVSELHRYVSAEVPSLTGG